MKINPSLYDIALNTVYEGSYHADRGVTKTVFDSFAIGTATHAPSFLVARGVINCPTFPIYDADGDFAGWGFRTNNPDYKYYYYNVTTSDNIYGLPQAIPSILEKDEVIVVEGFYDVLLAHSLGMTNVVGAFSNSLSKSQILILGSFTKNIKLAFDSDNAGLSGTTSTEDWARRLVPDINITKFMVYPSHDFCDYATARLNHDCE
jgi:DNA primase